MWLALGFLVAAATPARALEQENSAYQFNVNPHYGITKQLSMSGNFGYIGNPDDYARYRCGWPTLTYAPRTWLQLWGGLDSYYTDNQQSADSLELRPFAGAKFFLPNKAQWNIYNYTRYEYRDIENRETGHWAGYGRLRLRFGVEIPLAGVARAWRTDTYYAIADVESFYRCDLNEWDAVNSRGGIGRVLNHQMRLELIFTAQFALTPAAHEIERTDNMIRLNLKIGVHEGVLGRLFNPGRVR